jgi:hypothetical protein
MSGRELAASLSWIVLVMVGTPALVFAILGGVTHAAGSKHYNGESGAWFGARLGARLLPYVLVPYLVLGLWATYPRMVLLAAALLGIGDGSLRRPRRMLRRRYRRDYRWLRRHTDPAADRAGQVMRVRTRRAARWSGRNTVRAAGRATGPARDYARQTERRIWRAVQLHRGLPDPFCPDCAGTGDYQGWGAACPCTDR